MNTGADITSAHPGYNRLLRLPEVQHLTGLRRSTLYQKIAKGRFPSQIRLGENIVAWREWDVLDWMERPT